MTTSKVPSISLDGVIDDLDAVVHVVGLALAVATAEPQVRCRCR